MTTNGCANNDEIIFWTKMVTGFLSYARQEIDCELTIHPGAKVKAFEERGLATDRSKKNRDIVARNYEHDRLIFREYIEKDRDRGLERDR